MFDVNLLNTPGIQDNSEDSNGPNFEDQKKTPIDESEDLVAANHKNKNNKLVFFFSH